MADDIEVFGVELDARMERFEKQMLQTANKTDANLNRIEKKMQITNNRLRKGLEFRGFSAGGEKAFRDVEGRIGSLKGMLLGGVAALGVSFGASELVRALKEDEEAARRLAAVLKTTGYAAGLSQQEIAKWAEELEKRTGRGAAEIQTVAAQLATFTSIGRTEFLKAIEVADDLAATFGGDLQSNLDAVARALDDPIKGFGNLQKRGFALADSELARVKAHLKAGEAAKAQGIILDNLAKQVSGAAEATNQGLTKSLNELKKQGDDTFKAFADQHGTAAAIAALDLATKSVAFLGDNMDGLLEAAQAIAIFLATRYAVNVGIATAGMLANAVATVRAKGAVEALNLAMAKNPYGLAVLAIAALVTGLKILSDRYGEAAVLQREQQASTETASKAIDAYREAAIKAAAATGEHAKEARANAEAMRIEAIQAVRAAEALRVRRLALLAQRQVEAQAEADDIRRSVGPGQTTLNQGQYAAAQSRVAAAERAYQAAAGDAQTQEQALRQLEDDIKNGGLGGGGTTGIEYEGKTDKNAGKKAEARRRAIEDMASEVAMQEAQLTNDLDRVKVLEREASVRTRSRALIDAEIVKTKALADAQSEATQKRLDDALLKQIEREGHEARRALDLELYQLEADHERVRAIEQQIEKQERVTFWQGKGYDLVTATTMATLDLAELEAARGVEAQRSLTAAREQHALTIAQLSGNEKLTKQLQDQAAIKERADRYRSEGRLNPVDAERQATQEVTRERLAATYGEHRELFATAFSDGVRAAMAGDLQGFLSNQFGNFADTMFQKAGEQIYDQIFGGVGAITDGASQGATIAATVTPAIIGAGATAASTMAAAITAAGAAAGAAMAASITAANLSKVPSLPGFSGGGYTGPGSVAQARGVVHAGEVVWSQRDIARAGGVGTVEAMRRGVPGYASGGIVGRRTAVDQAYSAMGRLASSQPSSQPVIVQLSVEEGGLFVPRVQALSGQVAIQTTATGVAYGQDQQRTSAMRRRQSLIG